jgi:hypothetical protein
MKNALAITWFFLRRGERVDRTRRTIDSVVSAIASTMQHETMS